MLLRYRENEEYMDKKKGTVQKDLNQLWQSHHWGIQQFNSGSASLSQQLLTE